MHSLNEELKSIHPQFQWPSMLSLIYDSQAERELCFGVTLPVSLRIAPMHHAIYWEIGAYLSRRRDKQKGEDHVHR